MIKQRLRARLDNCFQLGIDKNLWTDNAAGMYAVEEPKHKAHGDLSTNMALVIAGKEGKKPRDVANEISNLLQGDDFFDKIEIAGPGFINFVLKKEVWQSILTEICEEDENFGHSETGKGKKVLVEFVSANPTGPLSVGHGRQAVLGDAIVKLLRNSGYDVTTEYYYNDAGRQMRVLGESTRARYLELLGLPAEFPEDGYQGEYIREIAQHLTEEKGDSLKDTKDVTPFKEKAEKEIFSDIDSTLKRLGIRFDGYYNEQSLYENGHVDDVVKVLREKGLVFDEEGAVWFKTTEFGLEQDRVIIKSTGEPTYRLPDIAYHREKFRRGFDWMVNIFGADHIATVPDVLAGIEALGHDKSKVTVVMHQFVTLMRDGKQVKMSTRRANFVTVDELVDELGVDVVRYFFLMRKADSQLDFDLDLAASQSQENPVYYVQYAHARLLSIHKQSEAVGVDKGPLEDAPLHLLQLPEELSMMKALAGYPALMEKAAMDLAPHRIVFFLLDLAGQFHSYYNKHRVLSDDVELSKARLWFTETLRIVLKNGLSVIGVNAPDAM